MVQLAGCVITDEQGRILLIHRNTKQFQYWELPGGKVEEGEDEARAAARELIEELGVEVEITNELGRTEFTDKNGHFKYVWFVAKIIESQPTILEPEKFDQCAYLSLDEIPSLSLSANVQKLLAHLKKS